jgi:Kef-type K+ transport system membrane component KefB
MLALIGAVAILGPALALPIRWHVPIMAGELAAGIVLGRSGLDVIDPSNETLSFLANIGFALIMFVAGTRVPIRDGRLRIALRTGAARAVVVGGVAVLVSAAVARVAGTGHVALYAVVLASSSAALVLPIVDGLRLAGQQILQLLAQVAIADVACIVALPLVVDTAHVGRAAVGVAVVVAAATALYLLLRWVDRTGWRRRVHRVSEERKFALELRVGLVMLFALAAVAERFHVSIMLAGFGLGLAVAAVGEPRRLARQLFAVTEGFFGPIFFVWLGASLELADLSRNPSMIWAGILLGVGAVVAHLAARLLGQPWYLGGLASAQLGVPVAAATVGGQLHVLRPGEAAALVLGALITILVSVLCGGQAVRAGLGQVAAADRR